MFAAGWPRVLRMPPPTTRGSVKGDAQSEPEPEPAPSAAHERILQSLVSPGDGRFVAILSRSRLSLWSGTRHRVLLFQEDLGLPKEAGQPVGLCWAPRNRRSSSLTLALCTANGFVLTYCVETLPEGAAPKPNVPPSVTSDPRFSVGRPAVASLDITVRIPECEAASVTCVASVGSPEGFFIGTSDGRVLFVAWRGCSVIGHFELSDFQAPRDAMHSPEAISCMAYDHERHLLAVSIFAGSGALCSVSFERGGSPGERLACKVIAGISCQDITALAFNPRLQILTIGRSNGATENHVISNEVQPQGVAARTKVERVYSVSQWGMPDGVTGAVSSLEWTSDGSAIAVGWEKSGVSVWSLYGCRLLCTAGGHPNQTDGTEESELLKSGVAAMCWVSMGLSLLVAELGRNAWMTDIPFVKSAAGITPSMHSSTRIVLVGSDNLWLLSHRVPATSDFSWSLLPVPEEYIAENWPLERVAVDRDGDHIAVSGKKGFVLYNCLTNRWKLFGNKRDEDAVSCCGLCWHDQCVAIVNRMPDGAHKLQVYPRRFLSGTSILGSCDLPRRPLFIECVDSYVAVLCSESFFYQFQLVSHIEDNVVTKVEVNLIKQLSLASVGNVSSLSVFRVEQPRRSSLRLNSSPLLAASSAPATGPTSPPLSSSSPPLLPPGTPRTLSAAVAASSLKLLLLDDAGNLSLRDSFDGRPVLLATKVEQFWHCRSGLVLNANKRTPVVQQQLGSILCAYGEDGLQLWQGFTGESTDERPLSLMEGSGLNDEVYPVGLIPEFGVIIGLSQLSVPFWLPSPSVGNKPPVPAIPQFRPQTKTHPFVHRLLHEAIAERDMEKAAAIAQHFGGNPILPFVLELLLFEALEASAKDINSPDSELEETVRFLRGFPDFPVLVVRCARKTESMHWPFFFGIAGDAVGLFEECLRTSSLANAAPYLCIILELRDQATALSSAVKILNMALAANEYELAADVVRFIMPEASLSPRAHQTAAAAATAVQIPKGVETALQQHLEALVNASDTDHINELQRAIPFVAVIPERKPTPKLT